MKTVIIDVRTAKEFSERALPGAINIPSNDFTVEDYLKYSAYHICLVCESGNRARSVMGKLNYLGISNVSVLDKHMKELPSTNGAAPGKWSIDRQFRLILAFVLGLFLVGSAQIHGLLILPAILFLGLTYSALTDNCYLKEGIARLPWNRPANS